MKPHSVIQCCVRTPGLVPVEQQQPHCVDQHPGKPLLQGPELPSWRKPSCKPQRSHPEGQTLLQAPELLFQGRDAGPKVTRATWQLGEPGHNVFPLHLCSCVSCAAWGICALSSLLWCRCAPARKQQHKAPSVFSGWLVWNMVETLAQRGEN